LFDAVIANVHTSSGVSEFSFSLKMRCRSERKEDGHESSQVSILR